MSFFAPETGKERRALLRHLDSVANKQAIADRVNSIDYQLRIQPLRKKHEDLYSGKLGRPTVEQYKLSPWEWSGLRADCVQVAEEFSVPYWTVLGHAGSESPLTTWLADPITGRQICTTSGQLVG